MSSLGRKPNPHAPPSYTGGRTYIDQRGYVQEKVPDHPKCSSQGYVQQHRLVAEKKVGRYLSGLEIVHHLNGQRDDNRPENLEILSTRSDHGRVHAQEIRVRFQAPLTEESVREALQLGSLSRAAAILGVHSQTIRNRFPELVAAVIRAVPGSLDPHAEALCSFAMQHPDPHEAIRILAGKHRVCVETVKNAIRRWSGLGGSRGESAKQLRGRLRLRSGPKRKASRPAYVWRGHASDPQA